MRALLVVVARRFARVLVPSDVGSDAAVAGTAHRVFDHAFAGGERAHADDYDG